MSFAANWALHGEFRLPESLDSCFQGRKEENSPVKINRFRSRCDVFFHFWKLSWTNHSLNTWVIFNHVGNKMHLKRCCWQILLSRFSLSDSLTGVSFPSIACQCVSFGPTVCTHPLMYINSIPAAQHGWLSAAWSYLLTWLTLGVGGCSRPSG